MAKGFFDIENVEPESTCGATLVEEKQHLEHALEASDEAEKIKERIFCELESGRDPQVILYEALNAIGLLTNDTEFTHKTQAKLDSIYKDLAQLSMLQDNDLQAKKRLRKLQADYNNKLKNSLERQLAGCRKIEQALNGALQAVNERITCPSDSGSESVQRR